MQETQFQYQSQEDPWKRKWQPTPVLLPGKFHGQRSLAGYSLSGHKRNMTEWLNSDNTRTIPHTGAFIPDVESVSSFLRWVLGVACVSAKAPQSCPILCNPMDCSPQDSSVHGISQARILEWVAISFSRDLPDPGIKPASLVSPPLAARFFTTEPP